MVRGRPPVEAIRRVSSCMSYGGNRIIRVALEPESRLRTTDDRINGVVLVELESGHFVRMQVLLERRATDGVLAPAAGDWIGRVLLGSIDGLDGDSGVDWLRNSGSSPEALAAAIEARRWGRFPTRRGGGR